MVLGIQEIGMLNSNSSLKPWSTWIRHTRLSSDSSGDEKHVAVLHLAKQVKHVACRVRIWTQGASTQPMLGWRPSPLQVALSTNSDSSALYVLLISHIAAKLD